MDLIWKKNANLVKLLVGLMLRLFILQEIQAQETDPISEAIQKEKQEIEGINMNPNELRELERINTKYKITDKEKEIRLKSASGQKIGLIDKFRIGKANRKEYLWKKKIDKFNRKLILNRQNQETKKRMLENEKSIKAKYKQQKRKQRRKKFINLFK